MNTSTDSLAQVITTERNRLLAEVSKLDAALKALSNGRAVQTVHGQSSPAPKVAKRRYKPRAQSKWPDIKVALEAGVTHDAIAKELGITLSGLNYHLRRHRLPLAVEHRAAKP